MYLIGLTGGIAAGKSVVAQRFAEHGALVVDADRLAREAVEPGTAGLAAIRAAFGDEVIAADGTLDRPALGAIVFADHAARETLNGITHPAIWRLARERFATAVPGQPVVYDVPLLVEASAARQMTFDRIVVVDAPREVRLRRLVELRGMDPDEAGRRIDAQASDEERRAVADIVIDAGGSLEETLRQADAVYDDLRAAASAAG